MSHPTVGEIRPNSAESAAVPFDFASPAVLRLPELLEVSCLAAYIHARLIELREDLPSVLSGLVQQEARAYLNQADTALRQCAVVIARGAEQVASDREGAHHG